MIWFPSVLMGVSASDMDPGDDTESLMNEMDQLRQEAEHLQNAIWDGRMAACVTTMVQDAENMEPLWRTYAMHQGNDTCDSAADTDPVDDTEPGDVQNNEQKIEKSNVRDRTLEFQLLQDQIQTASNSNVRGMALFISNLYMSEMQGNKQDFVESYEFFGYPKHVLIKQWKQHWKQICPSILKQMELHDNVWSPLQVSQLVRSHFGNLRKQEEADDVFTNLSYSISGIIPQQEPQNHKDEEQDQKRSKDSAGRIQMASEQEQQIQARTKNIFEGSDRISNPYTCILMLILAEAFWKWSSILFLTDLEKKLTTLQAEVIEGSMNMATKTTKTDVNETTTAFNEKESQKNHKDEEQDWNRNKDSAGRLLSTCANEISSLNITHSLKMVVKCIE